MSTRVQSAGRRLEPLWQAFTAPTYGLRQDQRRRRAGLDALMNPYAERYRNSPMPSPLFIDSVP